MKMIQQATMVAALSATMILATSAPSSATLYTFSFSGAELMQYFVGLKADGTTAAADGIYNGARSYTTSTGTLYSWQSSTSKSFNQWAQTTDAKLTSFNLWGYGDVTNSFGTATATAWGETFLASSWSNATATTNWVSALFKDDGTLNMEVLGFGATTGYTDGLSFDGTTFPTFTFTVDLNTTTIQWYNNTEGSLVFWFGGNMVDADNDYLGLLQGNIVLTGTPAPVPEPSTMVLLTAGLAGFAFYGRRRS